MPEALTDIERNILDYMVSYLRSNTYQPSIREIGHQFGIKSTKTVSEHLRALTDKGFLERDPARSRGVRILGMDLRPDAVTVPVFRGIPQHREGLHADLASEHLTLDRELVGTAGSFLLRLTGDELAVLGMSIGDLALVEPIALAELSDGAILLVRGAGGVPVFRRLSREGNAVQLEELRAGAKPERVEHPARLEVIGRVSGFWRPLRVHESTATRLTAH